MRQWRLWTTLFVFASFVSGAEAQEGTATIRGRIVDQQDSALPGVTIV